VARRTTRRQRLPVGRRRDTPSACHVPRPARSRRSHTPRQRRPAWRAGGCRASDLPRRSARAQLAPGTPSRALTRPTQLRHPTLRRAGPHPR
jgi:hypothetical protein